jgi:hypothetical protein
MVVTVDGDGVTHRVVSHTEAGDVFAQTATVDLFDFGARVDIDVPAASEVTRTESAATQFELQELIGEVIGGGAPE